MKNVKTINILDTIKRAAFTAVVILSLGLATLQTTHAVGLPGNPSPMVPAFDGQEGHGHHS